MVFKLFSFMIFFYVFVIVNGCGSIPAGQERTINFALSDFNLAPFMVYSENLNSRNKVSSISTSKNEAEARVQRLIRQSVVDVLYEQGRSALLPDNVISSILQQIDVQISYDPLNCENVITKPMMGPNGVAMKTSCIIVEDKVINTCFGDMCTLPGHSMHYKLVLPQHLLISGSLKTSNIIMAKWSNQMWQSVLNRVLRAVTSSSTGLYFYGAIKSYLDYTITLTVTDFKLPAVMAYSEDPAAKTKVSTISTSRSETEMLVRRVIMKAVEDALYQQGRSAFLKDNTITSILQQLDVRISYEPMNRIKLIDVTGPYVNAVGMNMINCIISDGTFVSTCSDIDPAANKCKAGMTIMNLKSIDSEFRTISGSLKTSNAVMATWSNQMWESILNRVLQNISSSLNGSYFYEASVKIN